MLSAVANFLFGTQAVPVTNAPEEVDLQVNEAEDWLLVDVSDKEDHDYDTIEDLCKNDECDGEDDVLSSVPEFLSSVTVVDIDPTSDSSGSIPLTFSNEESWLVTSGPVGLSICEFTESQRQQQNLGRLEEYMKHRASLLSGLVQSVRSMDFSVITCMDIKQSLRVLGDLGYEKNSNNKGLAVGPNRTRLVTLATPYPHKTKHNKQDRRVRHPAEVSGNFINHQPQFAISKVELLEQIKQLKPSQQAKERDSKKNAKKSQMDRQNKTYQYESANKSKRRRDFYNNMRRSGANNNRKC